VLQLAPKHSSAIYQLGVMAKTQGDEQQVKLVSAQLTLIDPDIAEDYEIEVGLRKRESP
jgi:hypothetical protein